MHGVVGTALGGVCTLVGEPQNLLIGERLGWDFVEFFLQMAPITIPVLFAGLATTVVLELTGAFGFGAKLPKVAADIIENYTIKEDANRSDKEKYGLIVQGVSAVLLIAGLALHIAPVGFIGLALIILNKDNLLVEWVYAGFFMNFILGCIAHLATNSGNGASAVVCLVVLFVAWPWYSNTCEFQKNAKHRPPGASVSGLLTTRHTFDGVLSDYIGFTTPDDVNKGNDGLGFGEGAGD